MREVVPPRGVSHHRMLRFFVRVLWVLLLHSCWVPRIVHCDSNAGITLPRVQHLREAPSRHRRHRDVNDGQCRPQRLLCLRIRVLLRLWEHKPDLFIDGW